MFSGDHYGETDLLLILEYFVYNMSRRLIFLWFRRGIIVKHKCFVFIIILSIRPRRAFLGIRVEYALTKWVLCTSSDLLRSLLSRSGLSIFFFNPPLGGSTLNT